MDDPLAGRFPEALRHRARFTEDDAPALLFGVDTMERVVAAEQTGQNEITLYRRLANGTLTTEKRVVTPWLVTSRPHAFSGTNDTTVTPLNGAGTYSHLVEFASWKAWQLSRQADLRRRREVLGPTSLVTQSLMRHGITSFLGMHYPDLARLQFDIETTTLDPADAEAEVIMIAVKYGVLEQVLINEGSEAEVLDRFVRLVRRLDPDVLEGHNVYAFDLPYLLARALKLGVRLRIGRDGSVPRMIDRARGPASAYVQGRHVIDTLPQVQRYDIAGNLTRYGLKDVIAQLGLERNNRVMVAPGEIRALWQRDPQRLAAYALDDVRDVDQLSQVIMPNAFYQAQIVPMTYQGVTLTGSGRKIEELLIRAYVGAGHAIPSPQRGAPFPGGHVELFRAGVFSPVVKCDVESLYPSIMNREALAPRSDVLGAFPILLKELTARRLDAKQKARETDGTARAAWQGRQSGLKVLINSFYGYLGFGNGSFNDYAAAEHVTLEGQRLVKQVVRELIDRGAEPLEVDTDGVYFVPPASVAREEDERAFIARIADVLPEGIRLAHDGRFRHMLSLKLKTYALIDANGRLTMAGSALRSRALEPVFRRFLDDAARTLMTEGLSQAREIYFRLAGELQRNEIPVEQLARTTRIREQRLASRTRLKQLLDAHPERWRSGERVSVYERQDGSLGFADDFEDDANTAVLLKRLREAAERFRPAVDDAVFDAAFPLLTPTSDLAAARQRQPSRQLSLLPEPPP